MGKRRQVREIAFKTLFQLDMGKMGLDEVIGYFIKGQKATPDVLESAESMVRGVVADQINIDKIIIENAHHWELDRIMSVDRSLLRLAIFELLRSPDVPRIVVINEAIELAKKYSTPESGGFINGILDPLKLGDTD